MFIVKIMLYLTGFAQIFTYLLTCIIINKLLSPQSGIYETFWTPRSGDPYYVALLTM